VKDLLYDVDVHNSWSSPADLVDYLPERWRPYYTASGRRRTVVVSSITSIRPAGTMNRLDASPASGGVAGSDYELLREQLLDRYGIDRALLTFPLGTEPAFRNSRLAIELCRAANDWLLDRWLDGRDDRLYGLAMVPTGSPTDARSEILRLADHPRIAAVLMVANPLQRPFGDKVYYPIYAAATEVGLPIVMHIGGDLRSRGTGFASGYPTSKADHFGLIDQAAEHHVTSLACSGVFETFPSLRVLFNECGFGWLPSVFWALDAHYRVLKLENPDLNDLPSDYFKRHMWISSQPFDSAADPKALISLLETFGGIEDKICFASDYPHHDSENPSHVIARMPRSWRDKVLYKNAAAVLDWPLAREDTLGGVSA
jgi:uncharacterized protein